ncbi:unnamed protein product [Nyctereutes procyonoides]|uniref:(raccoon dog) hypothetical protein n=1 Tax=Nyctereutes procyonoides TaxID=34880 RepID=A0A811ZR20_NYCPR|nr:unnamed protein product [Nyctereutes procyonoides]
MPKRKVSSEEVMAKEGPKRRSVRMSAESAPAKVETKPKKVGGKGKRGAKGKQAKVANQRLIPAENGETKNESPVSDKAEEKEAKS